MSYSIFDKIWSDLNISWHLTFSYQKEKSLWCVSFFVGYMLILFYSMTSNSPVISEKKKVFGYVCGSPKWKVKGQLDVGTYIKPLSFLESIMISDLKQLFKNEHFNMSYLGWKVNLELWNLFIVPSSENNDLGFSSLQKNRSSFKSFPN